LNRPLPPVAQEAKKQGKQNNHKSLNLEKQFHAKLAKNAKKKIGYQIHK